MNVKYIGKKLETLEETRSSLHGGLDELIDETIKTGKAWIEKQDEHTLTARETGQLMDDVVFYLNRKYDEFISIKDKIADGNVEVTSEEENLSQSFRATVQSFSQTKLGGSADMDTRITCHLMERFGVLEEAVWSLKTNVEQIKQEQSSTGIECPMISTNDQKLINSVYARLDQLEERAYDTDNNVEELEKNEKELVKKLESVEQEIEMANKCMDGLAKKTESLNKTMEKVDQECSSTSQIVSQHGSRLKTVEEHGQQESEKVKTQIEELKSNFEELKTNHSALCQMMDNKLKSLCHLRHILNTKIKEKNEQIRKGLSCRELVEFLERWKFLSGSKRQTLVDSLEKLPHNDRLNFMELSNDLDVKMCKLLGEQMCWIPGPYYTMLLKLLKQLACHSSGKIIIALEELDVSTGMFLVDYLVQLSDKERRKLWNLLEEVPLPDAIRVLDILDRLHKIGTLNRSAFIRCLSVLPPEEIRRKVQELDGLSSEKLVDTIQEWVAQIKTADEVRWYVR